VRKTLKRWHREAGLSKSNYPGANFKISFGRNFGPNIIESVTPCTSPPPRPSIFSDYSSFPPPY
jgi:hypothetical protein